MDVYFPVYDTVKPCIIVAADDRPWRTLASTQTLFWHRAPAPAHGQARSSYAEQGTTYFILNAPAHEGLERLRAFRGWSDNWDAEGSKAPHPTALDFASKVFGLLAVHRSPEVTLTADGHPMFVYGAPVNGEVVVTGPGTIDYFFADDGAPEGEDVAINEGALPRELVSHLHSFA